MLLSFLGRTLFSPPSSPEPFPNGSTSSSSPLPSLPSSPEPTDFDAEEMAERYTTWEFAVRTISTRHRFCTLDALIDFIERAQVCGYYVHASRANVVAAYNELRGKAPFARDQRFPVEEYVDLDHAGIRTYLDQLIAACELPDRAQNISGANNHSANSDAKRSFDTALQHLRNFTKCTHEDELVKYGIYSRQTFEAAHQLIWGAAVAH
uniref:Putative coat protein n=1 Tax=Atrato Virga-like virus 1 TaxID=2689340 RepID=A0A6B9KG94_9VIRU|nr:putative coat protein [Atrato Virga-like virus 1]